MAPVKQLNFPPTPPETPENPGNSTNPLDRPIASSGQSKANDLLLFSNVDSTGSPLRPLKRLKRASVPRLVAGAAAKVKQRSLSDSRQVVHSRQEDGDLGYPVISPRLFPTIDPLPPNVKNGGSSVSQSPVSTPEKAKPTQLNNTGAKKRKTFQLTPTQVDEELIRLLNTPIDRNKLKDEKPGYNYVFLTPDLGNSASGREPVVKCGVTYETTATRQKTIRTSCKMEPVSVYRRSQKQIVLYKRAEALIHAELEGLRHRFACKCGTTHREYFEVSPDIAVDVTDRWTDFCEWQPWDEEGNLRSFWKDRLKQLPPCEEEDTHHHHERRAERWDRFTKPTHREIKCYNLIATLNWLWPLGGVFLGVLLYLFTFWLLAILIFYACIAFWKVVGHFKKDIWIMAPPATGRPRKPSTSGSCMKQERAPIFEGASGRIWKRDMIAGRHPRWTERDLAEDTM